MLFSPRQQLGGQQTGQQVDGHAGLDHHIQLMVDIGQRLDGTLLRVQRGHQILVFFVEHIGQGAHQGVLAVKIMVERAFGGAGFKNDILYCGAVISLLIKELPSGGDDPSPGIAAVSFCHDVVLPAM